MKYIRNIHFTYDKFPVIIEAVIQNRFIREKISQNNKEHSVGISDDKQQPLYLPCAMSYDKKISLKNSEGFMSGFGGGFTTTQIFCQNGS